MLPGKALIFHNKASLSGAYLADPIDVFILGFVASVGTGISIVTLVAVLYEVNNNITSFRGSTKLEEKNQKEGGVPSFLELATSFYHHFNSTPRISLDMSFHPN